MPQFTSTTATEKICALDGRIRAVAGGTSASKTISILFWLIDRALAYPPANDGETELISVVSETYGHLERGAMLDFENIMKDRGYWKESRWHGTKHTYTFQTGSKIEFLSIDTYGKAHGPRRDILYINECNNLEYKIADQLITRTRKIVWLDWNPSEEFWFYTDMQPNRKDIDFITLTYKDNEALDDVSVAEIESHMHNKAWWQVYGLGQLGEVEGRIYTGWATIDRNDIPHEARLERRGLDFGYSQDPAAMVDVYYHNGGYILDERLYMRGQSNRQLAQFSLNMDSPNTLLVADSAEPKSIDELAEFGVQVVGAEKGPGSLNRRIRHMQDQRITVTKQSYNLIKEYRRYFWKTDRDGNILTVPEPGNDHLLDAAGYALESLRPREEAEEEYTTGNFASVWG
jgi:phage terminase large subunit